MYLSESGAFDPPWPARHNGRMAGPNPMDGYGRDDSAVVLGTEGGRLRQQLHDIEPVERFKPTSGAVVGWCGLALAAGTVLWVIFNQHSRSGLRLGLIAVFGALVIWVTQFRPRATAYPGWLAMFGSLRDTFVPYVAIDELTMGQTLNVWVRGKRYVCIGIGKSLGMEMRQRARGQGSESLTGGRNYGFSGQPGTGPGDQRLSYQAFVLSRLDDLIAHARKNRPPDGEKPEVRQEYAVREIVGLAVSGAAVVLSFLI
jgi:hypothetical protein